MIDQRLLGVSGATGQLGRRVASRLADAGARQRLIVRDPARAPVLFGAEVSAPVSYGDGVGMRAAAEGVDTLLLISASEAADRVSQQRTAVDAAVEAGVERIVYVSFLGAAPDATFTLARHHWETEEHIRSTGVRFTFLRDNLYHHAFTVFTGSDGVLRGPAGDGRVASVGHDDVADVAVAVLLGNGHDGITYGVTGPEAMTVEEAVAELSRVAGRPIRYERETEAEAYASRASYGAPDWEVEGWVTTYLAIAAGEMEFVTDTVPRLTGHPAQSFREWLEANPRTYRHLLADG